MAKSQQTFSKSEKEKKRLKKRLDKQKKMEARKAAKEENGPTGIQFAYVDHNGNLTDTPPDPDFKVEYELEDIQISVSKKEDLPEEDPVRKGKVSFFDTSKGFGFIIYKIILNTSADAKELYSFCKQQKNLLNRRFFL